MFPKLLIRFIANAQCAASRPRCEDYILTFAQPLIAYFVIRSLLSRLDPEAQQKEEAKRKASAASRKLDAILANKAREYDSDDDEEYSGKGGRRRRRSGVRSEDLQLTSYEQTIAMEVVAPEDIPVSFDGMWILRLSESRC